MDGRVEIDQQITECNTQLEITNQEIQKLNEKISILESANEPKFHDLHPPTYFKVLIDAEKTETINLTFSYSIFQF